MKLLPGQGEAQKDPGRYWQLIGRPNYLTVTRLDITFLAKVVSQFLNAPSDANWDVVVCIFKYIKSASGKGLFFSGQKRY